MYRVHTCTYWYVPCLLKYFWRCSLVSNDCEKWYCVCVTCMWWYNTKSVPQLVSNINVIILVQTWYRLVCTSMYHYTCHVLVCTGMYRYVPYTLISYNRSRFQMLNMIRDHWNDATLAAVGPDGSDKGSVLSVLEVLSPSTGRQRSGGGGSAPQSRADLTTLDEFLFRQLET